MSFKSRILFVLAAFLLVLPLYGCKGQAANVITVYCDSDFQPALEAAVKNFEQTTGVSVNVEFGASGTLLAEIIDGKKKVDLLIPGAEDFMQQAVQASLVPDGSEKILAYLVPVIAVQKGNPKNVASLEDLVKNGITVAIGDPFDVPDGLYAYEILESNGLAYNAWRAGTVVEYADNSEALANLLVTKTVDAIIGWNVFAAWHPNDIDIIYIAPEQLPRLAYIPAAVCAKAPNKEKAQQFLDYLSSADCQAIFAGLGYITTEAAARQYAPNADIGGEYYMPDDYLPLVIK